MDESPLFNVEGSELKPDLPNDLNPKPEAEKLNLNRKMSQDLHIMLISNLWLRRVSRKISKSYTILFEIQIHIGLHAYRLLQGLNLPSEVQGTIALSFYIE